MFRGFRGFFVTALSATAIFSGFSTEASAQANCQLSAMPDGSKVRMCKDASGKWRPSEAEIAPTSGGGTTGLPLNAEVTYNGSWTVEIATERKMNFNNLSISSLLNQAMKIADTKTVDGDMRLTAKFSGNSFTAVVFGRNWPREEFSGTVTNGVCRMIGRYDSLEGRCDKNGFSGAIRGKTSRGQNIKGSFQSSAVQVVDLDERARQQLAAEKSRQDAVAAAEAKIRNAPSAGPLLTKKLEGFVRTDAQGWAFNRFDEGSITNVKVIDGSVKSGQYTLRGEYTYNGGAGGWVLAQMVGPKLGCIQFHDAIIGCRALRTPEQGQAMRNAFVGTTTGIMNGNSGNSGQACDDRCERARYLDMRAEQQAERGGPGVSLP